ncbi:MAG: folate-binding protein YgfZ [Myxococcales bacterium]|nr:folate-binding protein YgfZ [Myxococcales bacterium]
MTLVDTSGWGLLAISGGDRVRFLQGLTTINVPTLPSDRPTWGALLLPKGRVLSVFALEPHGEELWLRCEPELIDKTTQILERYAVMDDVTFERRHLPSYRVWSSPADVWRAPFVAGEPPQAPGSAHALEVLRIRGGFLRYGVDVDEDCFPFETPLAAFLDYEKGCYVGQEPVFRVHAQGNSARALRGLLIEGPEPVAPGAIISHPAKDRAGTITSAVAEGDHQLALGYLHRTTWEVGGTVTVAGRAAKVHELPF